MCHNVTQVQPVYLTTCLLLMYEHGQIIDPTNVVPPSGMECTV